jgi:5'-nucleotidase
VRIQDAATYAKHLVTQLMSSHQASSSPWLLNVNIPNLPVGQLGPPKVCRLGRRHPAQRVITQESPRGETMYWIGGAGPARDEAHDTDFFATSQGHVSITPLQVDLTEHDQLMHWKTAAENWEKIA